MEATERLLETTINTLFTQAARDGVITKYERDIISQVEIDVKNYCEALENAMDDGIIDQNEKQDLDRIISEIQNNAYEVALKDNAISRNERDLLIKLQKIIKLYYL